MKDKGLAWLGLVLHALVVWACDQETPTPPAARSWARRALAWLVLEAVTAIGWTVDHLVPIAPGDHQADRRGGRRSLSTLENAAQAQK